MRPMLILLLLMIPAPSPDTTDSLFSSYIEGRVVLPINYATTAAYQEFLSEVPQFEDIRDVEQVKRRTENGELVLADFSVWQGMGWSRRPSESEVFWWDSKTDEVWRQDTYEMIGTVTRSPDPRHGDYVRIRPPEAFLPLGQGATPTHVRALRDAVERALWEQETSMTEYVEERAKGLAASLDSRYQTLSEVVLAVTEESEELREALLDIEQERKLERKRLVRLEEENAELRVAVDRLQQQFNTLSLTLEPVTNPFDLFE